MEKLKLFFTLLPYLALLYGGLHLSLEVFFPYLRDPDFNHWEVDEGVGSYVQIPGWKKTLRPPRVLARDTCPRALLVQWDSSQELFGY